MERLVNSGCGSRKWGDAPIGYGDAKKARVRSTVQPKEALPRQDIRHHGVMAGKAQGALLVMCRA